MINKHHNKLISNGRKERVTNIQIIIKKRIIRCDESPYLIKTNNEYE